MVERRKISERKKGRKDFCVRDIVKVYGYTWRTEFQRHRQINRWMLFEVFKVSELSFQFVFYGAVRLWGDDERVKGSQDQYKLRPWKNLLSKLPLIDKPSFEWINKW
jgi:hypothetical protein